MNKEEIEELAFKDRKELANLNELDLLEIIEFLQLDRKQWINQYSTTHNDYVDLQQENEQLKDNWNIIKQEMLKIRQSTFSKYNSNEWDNCLSFNGDIKPILDKMQELEQGSDNQ